ncbi:MAG: YdcF family protein [Terriglobia bacterium]
MKKRITLGVLLLLVLAIGNPYSMAWIAGRLVVADDLEPSDAVVTLRSAPELERTRLDEAARLVESRYAPVLLVSVDGAPYFNQPIRGLVEAYLSAKGFPPEKLQFCENLADNTAEEAQALLSCLLRRRARNVIVVTSEYHTRRTRAIYRRAFSGSAITVRVHPAYHSGYWDPHWWRRRRWAKTFVTETLALAWSAVERLWLSPQPGAAPETGPPATQSQEGQER